LKNKIEISIVITTFNREKNLFYIIGNINKQIGILKDQIEIIICDSNSKKRISIINYIKQFCNLKIYYYNCLINHQAYKRNYGFKKSNGKYVIFIDDDCFPEKKFLYDYLKILTLNRTKTVYCGQVQYIQSKQNKNLIRYRQSRLITHLSSTENIQIKNFISMNMALNKKNSYKMNILFDEKFRHYGFEDFEYAYRLLNNFFKITLIKPLVYHHDNRDFHYFLRKYNYLGEFGIPDIIKINLDAAKKSIFYKINKNILVNFFTKIPKIILLISLLQKFIIFLEMKSYFYLSLIYKSGIFFAFLLGIARRKINYKENDPKVVDSWYK